MTAHDMSRVYQHGTLGMLVPGFFKGTLTTKELLEKGDFGIGTVSGLDGEMIVLDHTPYLVQSNGEVRVVHPTEMVTFATVHFDGPKDTFEAKDITLDELGKEILENYPYKNVFFAVKLTGDFMAVKTRAVKKQTRPFKTLLEVANEQSVFERQEVSGTVIGYFAPKMFNGMAVAGYHLHFLSDEKDFGGHLLDLKVKDAKVKLQPFETVEQHFPADDPEFLNKDLDVSDMHAQIKEAEG